MGEQQEDRMDFESLADLSLLDNIIPTNIAPSSDLNASLLIPHALGIETPQILLIHPTLPLNDEHSTTLSLQESSHGQGQPAMKSDPSISFHQSENPSSAPIPQKKRGRPPILIKKPRKERPKSTRPKKYLDPNLSDKKVRNACNSKSNRERKKLEDQMKTTLIQELRIQIQEKDQLIEEQKQQLKEKDKEMCQKLQEKENEIFQLKWEIIQLQLSSSQQQTTNQSQ